MYESYVHIGQWWYTYITYVHHASSGGSGWVALGFYAFNVFKIILLNICINIILCNYDGHHHNYY